MAEQRGYLGPLTLQEVVSLTVHSTQQAHLISGLAQQLLEDKDANDDARRGGGSVVGKSPNMDRSHLEGHQCLLRDYFTNGPKCFPPHLFRRRFRMNRPLFLRIVDAVTTEDPYFVQKPDAVGRLGLSALQKCTAAIRMLAYGTPADLQDEYLRLAESTALESLTWFCKEVHTCFFDEYCRQPTQANIDRILQVNTQRGFPGCIGSLDCMHWRWKNCPAAWAGQFKGKEDGPTIILEAVAGPDLWIWHLFFGLPGTLNDINVFNRSPLFNRLASGNAPVCNYTINGHDFNMGYYLADGIYPKWATLVQTISHPQDQKKKVSYVFTHVIIKFFSWLITCRLIKFFWLAFREVTGSY